MLTPSMAMAYFNSEKPAGFLWYEEAPLHKEKKIKTQNIPLPQSKALKAALRNKELKQKLDDAIQTALDKPTLENAINAQRVQKQVMDRSEKFSKVWLLAALLDPDLLSGKDNPNSLHRKLAKHTNNIEETKTLQAIAKDWGLLFYIKPDCIFCERFAPIIEEFGAIYKFQVMAISDEGLSFATFKGAKDTGLIAKINPLKETPMLYLVHRDGKQIHTIARGLTDNEKIKDNILLILELQGLSK